MLLANSSLPCARLHSILTVVHVHRVKDLENDKSNLSSALSEETTKNLSLKKDLDMVRDVLRERC